MKLKAIVLVCTTLASVGLFGPAANAAQSLNIAYFALSNGGPGSDLSSQPSTPTDFGVCCSSGPATSPDIAPSSALLGGLPVAGALSDVVDQSSSHQILWWTPSSTTGIMSAGTSTLNVPFSTNLFYSSALGPNTTSGDGNYYETAILSGFFVGSGKDVKVTMTSDDDSLLYVDGIYRGGVEGVTCCGAASIDLGTLTGNHSVEIFYADRAQVAANLSLGVVGAYVTTAVPEPATWAMLLLGFFGIGFVARGSRKKDAAVLA